MRMRPASQCLGQLSGVWLPDVMGEYIDIDIVFEGSYPRLGINRSLMEDCDHHLTSSGSENDKSLGRRYR